MLDDLFKAYIRQYYMDKDYSYIDNRLYDEELFDEISNSFHSISIKLNIKLYNISVMSENYKKKLERLKKLKKLNSLK